MDNGEPIQPDFGGQGDQAMGHAMDTQVDFWDLNNQDALTDGQGGGHGAAPTGATMGPGTQGFSEVVELDGSRGKNNLALIVVVVVLLGALAFLAYDYSTNPEGGLVGSLLGPGESSTIDISANQASERRAPEKIEEDPSQQAFEPVEPADTTVVEVVEGNPYWHLPNAVEGPKEPLDRQWNADEEESWRSGMAHYYNYQRYRTIQDVRRRRLRGSDVIFWDALEESKLWIRMWAVIGLAEFHQEVTLENVEKALGNERSQLTANFFKRFIGKANSGQLYVIRSAIRVLDERGRLIALKAIASRGGELRNLYLVAGTYDPSYRVARWAQSALRRTRMSQDRYAKLVAVVEGRDTGGWLIGDGEEPMNAAPKAPQAVAIDPSVDPDSPIDDFGNVEFYDQIEAIDALEEGDESNDDGLDGPDDNVEFEPVEDLDDDAFY